MKKFYLDTNHFVGEVNSPEKWQEAVGAQVNESGAEHLLETRLCHGSEEHYGIPLFDFHPYMNKKLEETRITLRQWLTEDNINLPC